jgi:hypothetical protein
MFQIRPPVQMITPTKGTGTMTLVPSPSALSFEQAGIHDGATVSYRIEDGSAREIGTGTYSAINSTLTRTVLRSTNNNGPLSLSGTAFVYTADTVDFFAIVRSEIPLREIQFVGRRNSKLMAPDRKRLAHIPWPIASLASSGISALSSVLALSW